MIYSYVSRDLQKMDYQTLIVIPFVNTFNVCRLIRVAGIIWKIAL